MQLDDYNLFLRSGLSTQPQTKKYLVLIRNEDSKCTGMRKEDRCYDPVWPAAEA
jgi:hypothetical protein